MGNTSTTNEVHPSARELIWDIWEHRFLTPVQVSRLYDIPPESARLVLDRVAQAGYLAAIPRPTISPEEPNIVYALDQRGADEVALQLGNDRKTVHWRRYHNQVGRQYMDHRLAVNDVRIALTAGVRSFGGQMREWTYEFEEREIRRLRFRIVSVFDVSQTDGITAMPPAPVVRLPSLDACQLWQRLSIIARTEGLTIDRTGGRGGAEGVSGWLDPQGCEIWIDPDLAPVMATKTLCHEIAHHYAAHIDCSTEHETIAESVACIVLGHFGIEAPRYSFRYLAHWPDLATFRAKLLDMQAMAIWLIERIVGEQQSGDQSEQQSVAQ